ncbi:hypothetical protein FRB98_006909 [Tulasnella sp. 332]|nr:hypothetical protein FRB98_006909 [Tulasnella sp. 332]
MPSFKAALKIIRREVSKAPKAFKTTIAKIATAARRKNSDGSNGVVAGIESAVASAPIEDGDDGGHARRDGVLISGPISPGIGSDAPSSSSIQSPTAPPAVAVKEYPTLQYSTSCDDATATYNLYSAYAHNTSSSFFTAPHALTEGIAPYVPASTPLCDYPSSPSCYSQSSGKEIDGWTPNPRTAEPSPYIHRNNLLNVDAAFKKNTPSPLANQPRTALALEACGPSGGRRPTRNISHNHLHSPTPTPLSTLHTALDALNPDSDVGAPALAVGTSPDPAPVPAYLTPLNPAEDHAVFNASRICAEAFNGPHNPQPISGRGVAPALLELHDLMFPQLHIPPPTVAPPPKVKIAFEDVNPPMEMLVKEKLANYFWIENSARMPETLTTKVKALGRGAYGAVELHRSASDEFTAVKQSSWIPNPSDSAVELRLIAMLEWAHMRTTKGAVHLVQGKEFWEDPEAGVSSMRMEYIHGTSLYGLMSGRASSKWTKETCAAIMYQLLAGVLELEARDMVHADIKPQNVLLAQDGRLVFCDFGFTRIKGSTLVSGGTDGYMPEETAFGVHCARDVFAVGMVMKILMQQKLWDHGDSTEWEDRRGRLVTIVQSCLYPGYEKRRTAAVAMELVTKYYSMDEKKSRRLVARQMAKDCIIRPLLPAKPTAFGRAMDGARRCVAVVRRRHR